METCLSESLKPLDNILCSLSIPHKIQLKCISMET